MYNGFSMFSTTRHVSRSTEPGFRYFSDGPLISARASAEWTRQKSHGEREREKKLIKVDGKKGRF
jgi:hypothetical protein